MRILATVIGTVVLASVGCIRPGDLRAAADLEVGIADGAGVSLVVRDGQAQIRDIAANRITMWAQAPAFEIDVVADADVAPPYRFDVENCMPSAEMRSDGMPVAFLGRNADRVCSWQLDDLSAGQQVTLVVTVPDADVRAPFVFAVFGDVQTALGDVDDVFARMNAEPDLRFIMCTGDLVQSAALDEYRELGDKQRQLAVPIFSTIGNHELESPYQRWVERYGRMTVHFTFKGVAFSFLDSANASIDIDNYDRLDDWLDQARQDVHIFGTHYPAIDPVGTREGSFRSRREASKLLSRLADGNVDLTLYGHIHSYYEFENAGIPAYISGGGGALPERLDGIERHFLRVTVDPDIGIQSVERIDVD